MNKQLYKMNNLKVIKNKMNNQIEKRQKINS